MSERISRRGFLGGLAVSAMGGRRHVGALPDPRLTARPGRPFRPIEAGPTRFGEHLARGGLLYLPETVDPATPAPLVVALHGGGGDTSWWRSLFDVCERHALILLAPEARARTWDRVHGDFGPDVDFIDASLRFTFERCAIDTERVALAGFSDGASYALSLGPSNGDLFTHLIAWSPGFSNPADPIVGRPRVLVSHGTADAVLPVRLSRDAIVPMFEMDGYDVTYVEFSGGHRLTDDVVARTMEWFLG